MKLRYISACFIFLLVLLLSGCACSHEWIAADCVNPEICAECQEIGAAALGHAWQDATCTEAKICSRCGIAQGDPLGHSYGEWEFGETQMSHACTVCAFEETAQIDREMYLESLLPGYWDFFGMYDDAGFTKASNLTIAGMGFHFGPDRTATFHMPEQGTQEVTWSFDSYEPEDGADSYYFTLTGETETYAMCLRYNSTSNRNQPKKELILLSSRLFMFGQYNSLNKKLVSNWGIGYDGWGNILGNPENWLTFREDRTVTGHLNGAVDGNWRVVPVYSDNWKSPSEYIILIENNTGDTSQILSGYLSAQIGSTLNFKTDRTVQRFEPISEKELEQIKIASEIVRGTWTSTKVSSRGETETSTTEFSVTINEDGTFKANLDQELHGTWALREVPDATDGNPIYLYCLYADGIDDEIYCQVNTYYETPQFVITHYPPWEATQIEFRQLAEEYANLFMEFVNQPVGVWEARETEHSVTFYDDFTFSGNLNGNDISGTWSYRDHYFDPEEYRSDPENNAEHYWLEADGMNAFDIMIKNDVLYVPGNNTIELIKVG